MNQRGRKSLAALAVVDAGLSQGPAVPAGLTDAERSVWLQMVNSKPGDWFGSEHVPMMVEYVRQVCRGHVVDAQLRAFEPEWLATDEGLKRYEKLAGLAVKISGIVTRLATCMRLTQQSSYRADKVIPKAGRKLWQREPKD